jgi:predicted PurR-regulated permease PerM
MVFDDKETAKFWTLGAIIVLGILVFILLKPVIISVFSGLIIAYLCNPLYKRLLKYIPARNVSAAIILILLILIIILPVWLVLPITINQFFQVFKTTQTLDITSIFQTVLPSASKDFVTQAALTTTAIISKASAAVLEGMVNFFSNAPIILLNILILGFVFFFGLRDSDKLGELVREISPLNKAKEKLLVQQFKDITEAIIYGQLIIGIIQGLLAGIGFIVFGVPNAALLTILTIFFAVIPLLGPYIVYIPVAIFLLAGSSTGTAIAFILYNILIVSTLDNFLRAYIISKKTQISPAIVFVGMIAGLFMFGIIGLLIGPLILAYFLVIIQLYRDKELSGLFVKEEVSKVK